MEQIQGASGAYMMNVNSRGQAATRSILVSAIHEASLLGKAYSWTAVSADIVAGETGLLVVNDSSSELLVISHMSMRADVAGQAKIHCPASGVTWAGTAVIGNNLNRNFGNSAPARGFADETGSVFAAANVIETVYLPLAVNAQATCSIPQYIDFRDAVILGYDKAIAVDLIAEIAAFELSIFGYFIAADGLQ